MGTKGAKSDDSGQPRMSAHRGTLAIGALVVGIVVVVALLLWAADPLSFHVYTDKEEYSPGEEVLISVEFVNSGSSPINLTFYTGQMARFLVYDSSDNLVCEVAQFTTQAIVMKTLDSGESLVNTISWNQTGSDGLQVAPHESYTIRAVAVCVEFEASGSVEILISA